jgi:WD40 repeat protein
LATGDPIVNSVAVSSHGHMLASGGLGGRVRLWDVTDPAHPRPLGQPFTSTRGSFVEAVAFSSDGHTLASGNFDGTVRLWNVTDPAHPRPLVQPLITSSGKPVLSVAFSPEGLALASGNGFAQLWSLDPDEAIKQICTTIGGLTSRQWHKYISQLPYQPLCS